MAMWLLEMSNCINVVMDNVNDDVDRAIGYPLLVKLKLNLNYFSSIYKNINKLGFMPKWIDFITCGNAAVKCPVFTHAVRTDEQGNFLDFALCGHPAVIRSEKIKNIFDSCQNLCMKNKEEKIILFSVITLFWVLIKHLRFMNR